MNHKIRLGPVAAFLAVIAAVVATLAMLTFATSRADAARAERFAAVTAIRYELEKEGNRFLQAAEESAVPAEEPAGQGAEIRPGDGTDLSGTVSSLDGGWKYYTEKDGYALTVEIVPAGEKAAAVSEEAGADPEIRAGGWEIKEWKISKLWEVDDPFDDLWLG